MICFFEKHEENQEDKNVKTVSILPATSAILFITYLDVSRMVSGERFSGSLNILEC
jgi:hypothetical protein